MKKAIITIAIVLILIFWEVSGVLAGPRSFSPPHSFLTLYKVESTLAAGLKQRVANGIYATSNLEYRDSAGDLEFQVGAAYLLPYKVLFFNLYGGSGLQLSRNEGYQYPYILLGTHFLFFFSEVVHPLTENAAPKFRGGFSFRF